MKNSYILCLSQFCKSYPAQFWQEAICLNGQPAEPPVFFRLSDFPRTGTYFIMADGCELYLCRVTYFKKGYGYNYRTISRLIANTVESIGGVLNGEYAIPIRFFGKDTQPTDCESV